MNFMTFSHEIRNTPVMYQVYLPACDVLEIFQGQNRYNNFRGRRDRAFNDGGINR